MKKETRTRLSSQYPFAVPRMGCDFGNGWVSIFEELCQELSKIVPPDFKFVQVKEKFASLRIYANIHRKEFEDLIHEAAMKSSTTCEICGKEGKQSSARGWIKTLCEPHSKKFIAENKPMWEIDIQENGQ